MCMVARLTASMFFYEVFQHHCVSLVRPLEHCRLRPLHLFMLTLGSSKTLISSLLPEIRQRT